MKWPAFLVICVMSARCAAAEGWYLLPEPRFMGHEIAWPVPGSTSTVTVPAHSAAAEPEPLVSARIAKEAGLSLPVVMDAARANASTLLESLRIELVRDERGVILYALLASDNPLTASVVFAPGFGEKFLETIGPDVLVAIPNRFRVYVFPRSAVPGAVLSDRLFVDYGATNYPVSREVFEVVDGQLKAVGALR